MAVASPKRIIVRANAADTPFFADDLVALAGLRVDLLNLPKVNAANDVIRSVARMEARAGVAARLLVNIESATALANVASIADAHDRVAGVQVGLNDLFAAIGGERRDQRHVHAALWQVRLGAAAAPSACSPMMGLGPT